MLTGFVLAATLGSSAGSPIPSEASAPHSGAVKITVHNGTGRPYPNALVALLPMSALAWQDAPCICRTDQDGLAMLTGVPDTGYQITLSAINASPDGYFFLAARSGVDSKPRYPQALEIIPGDCAIGMLPGLRRAPSPLALATGRCTCWFSQLRTEGDKPHTSR